MGRKFFPYRIDEMDKRSREARPSNFFLHSFWKLVYIKGNHLICFHGEKTFFHLAKTRI